MCIYGGILWVGVYGSGISDDGQRALVLFLECTPFSSCNFFRSVCCSRGGGPFGVCGVVCGFRGGSGSASCGFCSCFWASWLVLVIYCTFVCVVSPLCLNWICVFSSVVWGWLVWRICGWVVGGRVYKHLSRNLHLGLLWHVLMFIFSYFLGFLSLSFLCHFHFHGFDFCSEFTYDLFVVPGLGMFSIVIFRSFFIHCSVVFLVQSLYLRFVVSDYLIVCLMCLFSFFASWTYSHVRGTRYIFPRLF